MRAQLGDWTFCVSGVGLQPSMQELVNITSTIGDHSTMLIPFHNPTDVHALLDIFLSGQFFTGHLPAARVNYLTLSLQFTAISKQPYIIS